MKRFSWLVMLVVIGIMVSQAAVAVTVEESTWGTIKALYRTEEMNCGDNWTRQQIEKYVHNFVPLEEGANYRGYPPYSFGLSVPFIKQVPPGDWDNTKNCGQACGVMLGGYYNGGAVADWVIIAENRWLRRFTGNTRYLNDNGWYTNFSGKNTLGNLLYHFHALRTIVYYGNQPDDIINEVAHGRPVLAGVRIKDGKLVGSGGTSHWVLVVGWDGRIVIHDPGTSSGRYKRYSIAAFRDSWEEEGKIYVPVFR